MSRGFVPHCGRNACSFISGLCSSFLSSINQLVVLFENSRQWKDRVSQPTKGQSIDKTPCLLLWRHTCTTYFVTEIFSKELMNRPVAVDHYCAYLKEAGEIDELHETLSALGRTEEAAMLKYRQCLTSTASASTDIRALGLRDCIKYVGSALRKGSRHKPLLYPGLWSRSPRSFGKPEPGPEIWVPVQQTQFVGQASCTNTTMAFSFQWTKSFWSRNQIFLEVGAGAKKVRCLEPEPEILVPAPQPWLCQRNWLWVFCFVDLYFLHLFWLLFDKLSPSPINLVFPSSAEAGPRLWILLPVRVAASYFELGPGASCCERQVVYSRHDMVGTTSDEAGCKKSSVKLSIADQSDILGMRKQK